MAAGGAQPRCTCDGRGVVCALRCLPLLLCVLGTFLLVLSRSASAQQPGRCTRVPMFHSSAALDAMFVCVGKLSSKCHEELLCTRS